MRISPGESDEAMLNNKDTKELKEISTDSSGKSDEDVSALRQLLSEKDNVGKS